MGKNNKCRIYWNASRFYSRDIIIAKSIMGELLSGLLAMLQHFILWTTHLNDVFLNKKIYFQEADGYTHL